MKKILQSQLLAFAVSAMLFSCSKDNATTNTSQNSMTATVSSSAFSASDVSNQAASVTSLAIWGHAANSYIVVCLDTYTGVGTYPIGTTWTSPSQYTANGLTKYAVHGQVSITSVSPAIVGTFSFTCDDSTEVTNGTFSVK